MQRRTLLTASGTLLTITLAGCSDLNPLSEDEPEIYNEDDKESLLIDEASDDWPDEMQRNEDINDNFDRVFTNDDESIIVMMSAHIDDDIETAEEEMERSRASAENDEDYPLAEDAFIANDDQSAWVTFRDVNARGHVLALRESGMQVVGDRNRASEYAEILFEHWQENA